MTDKAEKRARARALATVKHETLICFHNFSQRFASHTVAEFDRQASVLRPDQIDPGNVVSAAIKNCLAELYSEMVSVEVDQFMAAVEPPE